MIEGKDSMSADRFAKYTPRWWVLLFMGIELQARRPSMENRMNNGSKRHAWTAIQIRELKTLARMKTPAARIAKRLKRTEGATRQKAFSLGLSLDSRA
jgi:hypothetical protein